VEFKPGETVARSMLAGLDCWCRQAGQPLSTATLVYGGQESTELRGVAVRPWFAA